MFYMGLATLFISLMTILIKRTFLVNPSISPYDIVYWQGFISFPLLYLTLRYNKGRLLDIPKDLRGIIFRRGLCGALAHNCYLTSINLLEISKASVIFWTNPMITAFLAFYILKERITVFDYCALALSFVGVILI